MGGRGGGGDSPAGFDALPAIKVDYEPLPVVITAEAALKEGAPQLHDTVPGNLCTHVTYGDKVATDAAIKSAEVVIRQKQIIPRQIHHPIETRATLAQYDAGTEDYTLWTNTQIPHGNRFMICGLVLGIPYNKLRVIVPNIGGGFGSKGYLYQDAPLMLVLAKEVGRPVKWVDTREGVARTNVHSRGQEQYGTLAGNRDGKISALSVTNYVSLGAYPASNGPGAPLVLTGRSITGAYVIPHPFYEAYLAFSNTVSLGPARGAGRMEAMLMIERLVEMFAREIGMDPAEVRRKNMVPSDKFPFENGLGMDLRFRQLCCGSGPGAGKNRVQRHLRPQGGSASAREAAGRRYRILRHHRRRWPLAAHGARRVDREYMG